MSDHERPDLTAFRDLQSLVRALTEEMAGFRRRALTAEARVREYESLEGGEASIELGKRVSELEAENAALRARVETATAGAQGMLERVRFLRQQVQAGEP
jgi:hypothetical protein